MAYCCKRPVDDDDLVDDDLVDDDWLINHFTSFD
jgi:hypothetical protein